MDLVNDSLRTTKRDQRNASTISQSKLGTLPVYWVLLFTE